MKSFRDSNYQVSNARNLLSQVPNRTQKFKPALSTSLVSPKHLTYTAVRFFDAVDSPDPRQVSGAERWFDLFDQDNVQDRIPKRAKEKNSRIRIAVLDTGIDLKNPWIGQKARRIQCWPTDQSCGDTDGHGTHVAYLLLRLAPHAQLRIAKVRKSHMLRDADVEHIAKAIRHFSSDDHNRVDIIHLSFGFPQFHERLRPILTAIRAARENNVLVFAAAGNEGGNKGVFWPAKLYETGDVICVNASDSDGNASGFNPTTAAGTRICTLGEAVPSCERDHQEKTIHRSGTSFATPIAVSIAALVLGFVDNVLARDVPEDFAMLKQRLHTRSGMEKILHNTCVLSEGKRRAGFSYITPWFFLGIEERSRVHIIANELRSIPE
ncbi:subtilisin-like protein [Melanomma pulvis-pyrius CBS 109.77]|uniref:Subtilisin-like protein n=1 Tax=Melanomma pulvis-pyrius CBS 109.77 TaxID=1314802 RepID=A0A6A6XP98_9PLEO|nr:subtilisin-like protein [Melanomma pulvis-pyrius CBS 109.77]